MEYLPAVVVFALVLGIYFWRARTKKNVEPTNENGVSPDEPRLPNGDTLPRDPQE